MIKARDHLYALGAELARHRRQHPADDLLSNLVQAEVDGQRLTDDDVGAFMVLFTVAGNDTTRNTTTLATIALDQNPAQKAYLMEDFDARIMPAVDEFIRHGSPVMQFTRTALEDTELGGQQITAGDKVCVFYCSGNRDEAVFEHPAQFDLSRGEEPARRLRRRWSALLHRRRAGQVAAARPVRRDAHPGPRPGGDRRARVHGRELHPRDQQPGRARTLTSAAPLRTRVQPWGCDMLRR